MKPLPIIGLTGGIGMGKSTAAKILRGFGLPVYSADKAIHALLRKNGKAVKPVAKLFPSTLRNGAISRKALGTIVFGNQKKLKQLENILHPLIQDSEQNFLKKARQIKARAAIIEIPLLFETGGEKRCDYVITVTAPKSIQAGRVMQRKGMTEAKLKAIRARQMPDAEKRKRADFVVDTGGSMGETRRALAAVVKKVLAESG